MSQGKVLSSLSGPKDVTRRLVVLVTIGAGARLDAAAGTAVAAGALLATGAAVLGGGAAGADAPQARARARPDNRRLDTIALGSLYHCFNIIKSPNLL